MPKVLIADKLAPAAVEIFHNRGLETETAIGLSKDELIAKIPEFDGLVVRSACKPDADVIAPGLASIISTSKPRPAKASWS